MPSPVTLRDVALAANVSISTASRALDGGTLISLQTRTRIQNLASKLGYRPNIMARGLKTRTSGLIGVAVHNLANASFRVLAEIMQRRMRAEGFQVLLGITADDAGQELDTLAALAGQRIEGLIICPTGLNGAQLVALEAAGTPVTCVVRRDDAVELETVLAADPEGAFVGVNHLIELGHRRIGIIAGRPETTSGRERLSGYRRALQEAGITYDPTLVHTGRYEPETGLQGCKILLEGPNPPTALFVANHESALGVLRGLAERNIAIPGQMSLLCYEDMPGFEWQRPAISVVDSGAEAMAQLAADRLLARIRGGTSAAGLNREYRIGARLIRRQSCQPLQAA